MPLVVKDRVRETTTTLGTGTITLAGAVAGFQSFSAIGNANTTYYTINLPGANEWEVGIGTYTASGTTLSRDTILASSNSGSAVNFSAGTKDVFCTYPAGRSVYYDTSTNVTLNALTLSGGTANGVVYLNASKVATSGSALTFDGSEIFKNSGGTIQNNDVRGSAAAGTRLSAGGTLGVDSFDLFQNASAGYVFNRGNTPLIFGANNTEWMRLTSTGTLNIVGAGTAGTTQAISFNGSTPVDTLVTTSAGYVGIKTGSPDNLLTAQADATGVSFADNGVAQIIARGNTDSTKRLGLGIDTTNNIGVIQAQKFGTGTYPLAINPAGGDVGIGTNAPSLTGLAILSGGQGKGVLVARNATGSPTSGQSLGSYAFKGIMDGVNSNVAAEAMIEAVAAENQSGSTAATNLLFYTKPSGTGPGSSPTERARITSGGYFKASNSGAYDGVSSAYHELYQSADNRAVIIANVNASATTDGVVFVRADRNTTNNTFYALSYYNAGATAFKFRVADSGAIATAGGIALGTVTPATSGIGVQFPATQSASSNANTLDDYEEGNWTPTIISDATNPTLSYTAQTGRYIKIGRLVKLSWYIQVNTVTAQGTGNLSIGGIPSFTADSNEESPGSFWSSGAIQGGASSPYKVSCREQTGALLILDTTNGNLFPTGSLSGAAYLIGQLIYIATA